MPSLPSGDRSGGDAEDMDHEYYPDALLRRNLLIWGLGGVIVPFIGIKLIDMVLVALHLVS